MIDSLIGKGLLELGTLSIADGSNENCPLAESEWSSLIREKKGKCLMYRSVSIRLITIGLAAFFFACASAPPWGEMSQNEIAAWKADGLNAQEAQAWKKKGFDAQSAKEWHSRGFDLEATQAWMEEGFSAAEAKHWKAAGFSISQAAANRGKGLTPIESPPEAKPSETKSENAPESDSAEK